MNNSKILGWSITVALGGFLFGFDTAVISGAEQSIQQIWQLNDFMHGLAIAIALYGTVVGALFGGIPADRIGRKQTLFWIGVLYLVSALGSALATDQYLFMFFRLIGGLGVGASSVVAPMYISEIAPAKSRGRMVAMFQFNVVFGILIAYVSNYLLDGIAPNAWRWMIGIEAVPAIIFVLMVMKVPKSPRWLIVKKNDIDEARKVLLMIDPENVDESVKTIKSTISEKKENPIKLVLSGKYNYQFMLVFLFAMFNQLSGINAIIYYAPRIFSMTGAESNVALLSTSGIGLMNLVFTILGMLLIDRVGRKLLMYIGSVGLILTLSLVAYSFNIEAFSAVPLYLFGYISFFAFSQGAVIWVFISEIFPLEVKAFGQSFGCFIHWFMAAVIANTFPLVTNLVSPDVIFLFFGIMMVLQLLFVWRLMPETKGKSLEELAISLTSKK